MSDSHKQFDLAIMLHAFTSLVGDHIDSTLTTENWWIYGIAESTNVIQRGRLVKSCSAEDGYGTKLSVQERETGTI